MALENRSEALWREFQDKKDQSARQGLVAEYLPLVKLIVGRMPVRLPTHLEREDLVSFGVFGLLSAVEKFDPSRGVKFETYASQRIRGAILDALRQNSWVPRSVNEKLRRISAAFTRLEQSGRGEAGDAEAAREAGLSVEEMNSLLNQAGLQAWLSLEVFLQETDGESGVRLGDTLINEQSPDPASAYQEKELKEALARGLEELGERDRLVLTLYYYEELTLKEIGRVLDVSESRVSQLQARALLRLRELLRDFS